MDQSAIEHSDVGLIFPSTNVTHDLLCVVTNNSAGYEIECFVELSRRGSPWFVKIRWLGFDEIEDSWEPVANIMQDCPSFFKQYLRSIAASEEISDLLRSYDIKL